MTRNPDTHNKTGAVLMESSSVVEAAKAASHLTAGRAVQVAVQRRVPGGSWYTVAVLGADPAAERGG